MKYRTHILCGLVFIAAAPFAFAHDLPLSYVDLKTEGAEVEVIVQASAKNFARQLPGISEESLLDMANLTASRGKLAALINSHLAVSIDGKLRPMEITASESLPARRDLKLRFHVITNRSPESLRVRCDLFSFDSRHRTFLNVYNGGTLRFQGIFDRSTSQLDYVLGTRQPIITVVRQFLWEGVHHIFIGPDHILFVVGLLLLGGTVWQLLRIVTAFTVAHTVTLVLATLNILTPPARIVEPLIALSIVFVGVHALLRLNQERDWRLLFAFCFGFVHGFGFANVLREMALPRAALGWSLFSFNAGVEIGQACIVLAVSPLLAFLYRRTARLAGQITTAGSFGVVATGSFWLLQRVFP